MFAALQRSLGEACAQAPNHPTCLFYGLSDLQYFSLISPKGYAPFLGVDGLPLADVRAVANLQLVKN